MATCQVSKFLFFCIGLLVVQSATAMTNNSLCSQENVKIVSPLVDVENSSAGRFNYVYQEIDKSRSEDPVIFVFPGGPGGTSISLSDPSTTVDFDQILWGLPNNYHVIFTDPRTRGCNKVVLPTNTLTTENLANDIVEIIRERKISSYILYGHSYGSIVASTVANQVRLQNLPNPRMIILSGTPGKAFLENDQQDAIESAWRTLRAQLPKQIAEEFPSSYKDIAVDHQLPFGIPGNIWSNHILSGLTEGSQTLSGQKTFRLLNEMLNLQENSNSTDNFRNSLLNESQNQSTGLDHVPIFRQIMCRELLINNDECKTNEIELDRPYNSGSLKTTASVVYIHGENDPAVPISSAKYQFENGFSKDSNFVTVKDGGHVNLLALNDCKSEFWNFAFHPETHQLKKSLAKCSGFTSLEEKHSHEK